MGSRKWLQGQRSRSRLCRSARGVCKGQQLSFLTFEIDATPAPWVLTDLIAADQSGRDSTRAWRRAVEADFLQQYGINPPGVAATFVLQWVIGALADTAVNLSPRLGMDWAGPGISIELAEVGHFPQRVVVDPASVLTSGEASISARRAKTQFDAVGAQFAGAYNPGVKISSRQRVCMLQDMWRQAAEGPGLARGSCCLIYALPGLQTCGGCPRLR